MDEQQKAEFRELAEAAERDEIVDVFLVEVRMEDGKPVPTAWTLYDKDEHSFTREDADEFMECFLRIGSIMRRAYTREPDGGEDERADN